MSSLKYWVWLSSLSGVGAVAAGALLRHFGTPEKVFSASSIEFKDVSGIKPAHISRLSRKNIEIADKILSSCEESGCRVITLQDAEYPERLRNIYDPPVVLYIRGILPVIDDEAVVAVVGTRGCTPYGISVAENTGYQLARHGLIVATGLARGIDSFATRGALRGSRRVIGVIGSGLDVIYPPENKTLFDDVASGGVIISEYPPGTPPVATHFPARNRILSGISLGVAVIEAPKKSGALITAARALEQGRDVFALPGNVDARNSEGSNALLREGAIPILSGEDVINEYAELFPDKITVGIDPPPPDIKAAERAKNVLRNRGATNRDDVKKEIDNEQAVDYIDLDKIIRMLADVERTVAQTIGTAALHIDEIILRSNLSAQQVLTSLTMLEIKGYAVRSESGIWKLENAKPEV